MFFVDVGFGESASTRKESRTTFEFGAEAERDAFVQGIDAAIGWFDYEIFEENAEAVEVDRPNCG